MVFWHSDFTKLNFGWGSAPDPAGGAFDAPADPLVGGGGGYPSPFPTPSMLTPLASRLNALPPKIHDVAGSCRR